MAEGTGTDSVVALVPMRHESERLPGKNYRDFAGKPLFHHIIETLLACDVIDRVVIDTDSDLIWQQTEAHFPGVSLLERPAHLCPGTIPMNDVLLNATAQIGAHTYLQTHCTNPLLTAETITRAVETHRQHYPVYDTLFGVTRRQTYFWDQLVRPVNHNPAVLQRSQDLPPFYEENSNLYIFTRETLVRRHNRIGERPYLFEIDRYEAYDINEEMDFVVAEFLYRRRR
ncbi:MAG: acylneuraminate cytidylyltransferase family protein [Chloroflexota bacterium]